MQPVTLSTIGGGAAEELFDHALREVVKNVDDPNTDSTAKRRITLTIDIQPREDRQECTVTVGVKQTLAPVIAHSATIHVGVKNGEALALAQDFRQMGLFEDDQPHEVADFPPATANDEE